MSKAKRVNKATTTLQTYTVLMQVNSSYRPVNDAMKTAFTHTLIHRPVASLHVSKRNQLT